MRERTIKAAICICAILLQVLSMRLADGHCETFNLKFSIYGPAEHLSYARVAEPWARKIEQLTGNRVKVDLYPGGALGDPKVQHDLVLQGVADIAMIMHGMTVGRFPLTSVMELPFMAETAETGSLALWKIYEKFLQEEYRDVKVLWFMTGTPAQIHTTKREVKVLEDMQDLKIRSAGSVVNNTLKRLGAVPMILPITDVYTALERGTIDGVAVGYEIIAPYKLYEFLKYTAEVNLFSLTFCTLMNKKKWESLPPDIKKMIDENSGEKMSIFHGRMMDQNVSKDMYLKGGGNIYPLPASEKERWRRAVEPILNEWAAEMEGKGLSGKRVLEGALQLRVHSK